MQGKLDYEKLYEFVNMLDYEELMLLKEAIYEKEEELEDEVTLQKTLQEKVI